jgi:hypothetical protein
MPKRKAPRRPSPLRSPQRDARRKLAIVTDLAATIQGVRIATNPAILANARQKVTKEPNTQKEKDATDGLDS